LRWSELRALLSKDLRELFGSTSYFLLLLMAGPLTGLSFIAAVRNYFDASAGTALASAISPLDGILLPTLGAYDILITFIVPFVAIRLLASEKSSGALRLLLQAPASLATQLASKVLALLCAWIVALIPAAIALILWRSYGGHLDPAETTAPIIGFTLLYLLICSVALAAASIFANAASAAIAVLTFTIATWAIDLFGAWNSGWIGTLAPYTPGAMLRQFGRGLVNADVIIVGIAISLLLLTIAALVLQPSRRALVVLAIGIALLFVRTHRSADLSEDRRNSFSPADEKLLRSIDRPLSITIYLAAEDPRAKDYERNVLTKLRRVVRDLRIDYPYGGRTLLFDNDPRYGTIEYRLGAKHAVSRSTTDEIVLDELETLAGLTPPQRGESTYPGYPLRAPPLHAATLFYVIWPLAIAISWLRCSRRTG